MRQPMERGAPINMNRVHTWVQFFSGYRHPVNEDRIDRWRAQFARQDGDLAARMLDCVDFISHDQMLSAFRSILNGLEVYGWNKEEPRRNGRWRFVAFSLSAGESGDSMLHKFRFANGLNGKQYNDLFIHKSELLTENLGVTDTVVFIDDFSGTGGQVCEAWPQIQELLPNNPNTFLVLVAASASARIRIGTETGIAVIPYIELTEGDNVFSDTCQHFTSAEKDTILKYCRKADRRHPKGFGDCGFVVVLAHNCPNNSIPILHAHNPKWEGLFRRYD